MEQILAESIEEINGKLAKAEPKELQTIKGHVAVITGAAGGIGSALAFEMARRGAAGLALVDFNERVATVAQEINAEMERKVAIAYSGDTANAEFRHNVYESIGDQAGVPRICVLPPR